MLPTGDTIAAIATPPGVGAVAIVRVSGPGARSVLRTVCPKLSDPEPRRQALAEVRHPQDGGLLDRALVTFFPGPASYTGEDVAEISTHGGPLAPRLVLDALLAAGARPAHPGEFTRRAYLNGKLDLLQAEAVLDLVEGRSEALHRAALQQADRGLSLRVEELRSRLLGLEAAMVHFIDFPEEDQAPLELSQVLERAREVEERMRALLATAAEGEMLREGALVVLAGRPNSGKSSLFNALLGRERAIVTEVAGTTRDALEAEVSFGGYPIRLVDTAGLRGTEDLVEGMGIEVAHRFLSAAGLVILCVEAGREPGDDQAEVDAALQGRPVLRVRTKADLLAGRPPTASSEQADLAVSAFTGEGLSELRSRIAELSFATLHSVSDDAPLLTRRRQARALAAALEELEGFIAGVSQGLPPEICSTHLRDSIQALESLIGAVDSEDLLDEVFTRFCVGK